MPLELNQYRPTERVQAVRITPDNLADVVELVRLHEGGDNVSTTAGGFSILRGHRDQAGEWERFSVGDWLVDTGTLGWPDYMQFTHAEMVATYERVEGTA
jgi:hypothetical protein